MRMASWLRLVAAGAGVLAAVPATAQQQRQVGDWTVGVLPGNEGVLAATTNETGTTLGEYCFTGQPTCTWMISARGGCEPGAKVPVLVNADAGSAGLLVQCLGGEEPFFVFTGSAKLDALVEQGSTLGVAFPMLQDRFRVSRFSLNGAPEAVALMHRAGSALEEHGRRQNVRGGPTDETY